MEKGRRTPATPVRDRREPKRRGDWSLYPGADGSWRNRLHSRQAQMRGMPAASRLHRVAGKPDGQAAGSPAWKALAGKGNSPIAAGEARQDSSGKTSGKRYL